MAAPEWREVPTEANLGRGLARATFSDFVQKISKVWSLTCFRLPFKGERAGSVATHRVYRITSSARASSDGGIVRPSALAVLRLMTSSNVVGCSTGRSLGLAPRILSTYVA